MRGKQTRLLGLCLVFMLAAAGLTARGEQEMVPDEGNRVFAGGWPYATPPTGHFNMFVSNAIELRFWREIHQLPLALFVNATGEYTPMLAESWDMDDSAGEMRVTLRPDARWYTGEQFTAEDVWTTFYVLRLVGNPAWDYIEEVTAVSDREVVFTIGEATPIFTRNVLRRPIVDRLTYGDYAERTADLVQQGLDSESREWRNLIADFNEFRPEMANATGPWFIDPARVTQSSIEMPRNPNSFLADRVHFDTLMIYNGDVPDLTPLVLSGEMDYLTHIFPASSMQAFEQMGYDFIQLPGVDGLAIYFNHAIEPLGDVRVRQAIAHVIDRERIGRLALPGVSVGVRNITGLGDAVADNWVDLSRINPYAVDLERAAALLEEAGLTQRNGQWHLPDGSRFTLDLQCPSGWADASTAAAEAAQQLTAFGIRTEFVGIESTQRMPNITSGNFEIAMSFFGTGQPHPVYAFEGPLVFSNTTAGSRGIAFDMVQETEALGRVDFAQLMQESVRGWDTSAQQQAINQIAIAFNETVPTLPIYSNERKNVSSNGLRTVWEGPDYIYLNSAGDDSFVVYQLLQGMIRPR